MTHPLLAANYTVLQPSQLYAHKTQSKFRCTKKPETRPSKLERMQTVVSRRVELQFFVISNLVDSRHPNLGGLWWSAGTGTVPLGVLHLHLRAILTCLQFLSNPQYPNTANTKQTKQKQKDPQSSIQHKVTTGCAWRSSTCLLGFLLPRFPFFFVRAIAKSQWRKSPLSHSLAASIHNLQLG